VALQAFLQFAPFPFLRRAEEGGEDLSLLPAVGGARAGLLHFDFEDPFLAGVRRLRPWT